MSMTDLNNGRLARKLAAILNADVVGYSRLMGIDERGTLERLKAHRTEFVEDVIGSHRGRVVKLIGDGLLVEFPSVVDAVECAVAIQRGMRGRNENLPADHQIVFRIGIHVGDVIVEGDDIYGDGVNVAARVEAFAAPGGVALSKTALDHVGNRFRLPMEDLGEQNLKNIAAPVQIFSITSFEPAADRPPTAAPSRKPSIVILPFVNMSGEQEQEFFSDGITEDIITDLSRVSALHVVSRNTSFMFKGKAVDVARARSQLKVDYLVEGSVRKVGGRVRITAQLIDTRNDGHLWAERYDRDLNDIFALQDEISHAIVRALRVSLLPDESKAIATHSTTSPDAYEHYLMARQFARRRTNRSHEIAIRFCERALEIDQGYAKAIALIAICRSTLSLEANAKSLGLDEAERALAIDPTLAEAHAAKGQALAAAGRYEEARRAHLRSLELDGDSYYVHLLFGQTSTMMGDHTTAAEHYYAASQIIDTDVRSISLAALALESQGKPDQALPLAKETFERAQRVISQTPDDAHATLYGASVLALLGEKDRATQWIKRALILDPDDPLVQYNVACAMVQVGDLEGGLDLLERCHDGMSSEFTKWTRNDIELTPLRDHPRFIELLRKVEARTAPD